MPKKIAVIDGNSLMHRAYHAVPQTMNAPDGRPTNAVFGFVAMLLKFIDVAHPDAVICAFDAGRPAFRTKALEQYKAQRPPMDDDLKVQFPIIEELLEAMNVPVVRVKGWEGDDVLGTVARRDEQLGYETLLVTGDKDAYQLASDKTRIVTTKKGITDVAIYGPAEVAERYGVTPAQVPDFLGLKGDSSDNIPGVPGIGEKTAAKLLQQYGSLEGLYENLDALKGKQLERIRDNKDAAFASREVATIVCDLDFPLDLEAAAFPSFEEEKVVEAFQKIQFNTHLGRVLKLVGKELEKSQAPLSWEPVVHGDEASALVEAAVRAGETVGVAFVEPEQVSLFSSGVIAAFCTSQGTAAFEEEEGLTVLARVVKSCPFAALDVKETLHRVYPADTAVPALVTDDDLMAMRAFDLGLAGYVLNSSVSEYSFDALLDAYCGGVLPDTKTDEERAVVCAAAARQLVEPLTQALERDGSTRAYFDIDLPLVAVLSIMERTGTALDCDRLAELGASTEDELAGLRERIFDMAGETFNLDSPKQLAHILFEVMGLTPLKKNQRGYSTDAAVLKELSKTHEMPALLLRYRELFQDQVHLHRRAAAHAGHRRARAHLLQRDGHHHGAPVVVRPEPAEHPRAHRVRPPDQGMLHAAGLRKQVPVGGLLADRAAPAGAPVRRRASGGGVLFGRRLPCQHRQPRVRRAAGRRDAAAAQPREGREFRHRLWPAGVRPGAEPGHPVRRGEGDDRPLLRGVSRRARVSGRHGGGSEEDRVRHHHVRPQAPRARAQGRQRGPARLRRAHGHEPSHAGKRRRHHQAGHEAGAAAPARRGL